MLFSLIVFGILYIKITEIETQLREINIKLKLINGSIHEIKFPGSKLEIEEFPSTSATTKWNILNIISSLKKNVINK
jgi:hypothetical protein